MRDRAERHQPATRPRQWLSAGGEPPARPDVSTTESPTADAARTWPDRRSVRHSHLRSRTAVEPLLIRFLTGVIPSQKRKGSTYVAFQVKGDVQSYTYEPENDSVRAYLEVVAAEKHRGTTWYELRADGRDETARLSAIPHQRPAEPGGFPRAKWGELHEVVREQYFRIFGHLPDADALRVAMLAFADAEEQRRISAAVAAAGRTNRRKAA